MELGSRRAALRRRRFSSSKIGSANTLDGLGTEVEGSIADLLVA